MPTQENAASGRRMGWPALVLAAPVLYVASSGPVLATAFWLREVTGWDGMYAAIWFYLPLLSVRDGAIGGFVDRYVTWWVELFGTVGPG